MKFFTCAFCQGELSDAEQEQVLLSYKKHINTIIYKLPTELIILAKDFPLDKALIRRVTVQRDDDLLALELVCADKGGGHFNLNLIYFGVLWDQLNLDILARRARDPRTVILRDEVGMVSEGLYEHTLLFGPEEEFNIRFSNAGLSRRPCEALVRPTDCDPYLEWGGDET